MKAKLDFKSKRTIIITAIIAVLAIGAGVGGYFYAKGNNQAGATNGVDGSQVTEQASTDTPSNNNPENDGADANNGNGADETTATTNGTTGDNTNGNNGNGATDGNAGNNGNATTGNNGATGNARTNTGRTANGTGNTTNGATTPTNADDTATTTYENVIENIVVEEPWESHSVNWTPEKLNTSIPEVNVNKPQLESSKTAYVQGEEITGKPVNTAIQKGGEITYVINIKNTGDIDASKVMVYDNVPEGTELVNNEEGTIETIKNNDGKDIQRIVWEKDVKAGEEVSVSFTVKVTADSIDLIENTAKVNGKDTDKTKTPVLTSSKKAILVDEDRELEKEESVKVGQKIKYVITAENTSEVDAVTTISDIVPEGTENATEITKPGELKDGTITWKNIPVKAGEKAEVSFVVTVSKDTIKSIKNAAKVADTDTPSVETKVANISTEKRSEASATPLKEEDTITYTLTATNKGDGKGSVIISDEVPTGTSIVGEEGKEVTLTSNSTTKTYSIDELVDGINVELESNETKSLTFTVKINSFTENDENVTTELDKETGIKTSTRIITNAEAKQDGKDIPETTDKVEKEYVKISTRKIWDDQDNQDGIRPDSITINLLENGTKKDSIIVKADEEGNWKYEFINLPKYINDKEVSYTVTEDAVTGYTPATTGNAEEGYTITNTHNVAKTEVSVTKVWEDNDDQDGIRPESITVQLKADGENAGEAVTLNEENNWSHTWEDLDVNKEGTKIAYTVVEDGVPEGYTSRPTGNAEEGYTITNTHTPELVNENGEISVRKVWEDNNDYYEERPESITVTLKEGNEVTNKTLTLSATNNWQGKFTGLPKFEDGNEISYSVVESDVDNYETSIEVEATGVTSTGENKTGFVVTNRYENVKIHTKTYVTSQEEDIEKKSKVDFVFVLDVSSSMVDDNSTKAKDMVAAVNKAIRTIMKSPDNRIAVVTYSGPTSTSYNVSNTTNLNTVLPLAHYDIEDDEDYLTYSNKKITGDITINVQGGTYTQSGIQKGAEILKGAPEKEGRTPVMILLTDGEPTWATSSYNNVGNSTVGNGATPSNTDTGRTNAALMGYYTILSANYFKNQIATSYGTNAYMFTIGMGLSENNIYARTLLNPDQTNMNAASETNSNSKTHLMYDYLNSDYNPYKDNYSYADGSYMGDMDENRLSGILSTITHTVTDIYTETSTRTTNIKKTPSKYELERLDTNKDITIKLDENEEVDYKVLELIQNSVVVVENEKYYIDLNASLFTGIKNIEITYYEMHANNSNRLLSKSVSIDSENGEIEETEKVETVEKEEKNTDKKITDNNKNVETEKDAIIEENKTELNDASETENTVIEKDEKVETTEKSEENEVKNEEESTKTSEEKEENSNKESDENSITNVDSEI